MLRSLWLLLLLALVLLLMGGLVAVAVRQAGPLPGDQPLALSLQPASILAGPAASGLAAIETATLLLPVAIILALLAARRWRSAILVLLGSGGALVVGEVILKGLVARPRPDAALVVVHQPATSFGFPSSTTMLALVTLGLTSAVLAETLAPSRPRLANLVLALAILVALLVGLSRVAIGAHWPSDIAGSLLFGGAWLCLLLAGQRAWRERRSAVRHRSARARA